MSHTQVPTDNKYTKTHEWAQRESDELITIGITDHAQQLLGDIVFVQLPEIGETINQGEEVGVIESVKAAADFYAPMNGEVVEVNEAVTDNPALINEDAYGAWLFKFKPNNMAEWTELLEADDYANMSNGVD